MLGNLSKVLFKAPGFFNNTIEQKQSVYNNKEDYTFNSFNTININKINTLYFREKDFWKKNYEPEINFNRNKRISFYLIKSPKRKQILTEANIINLNKRRFNTISKKRKNSYFITNSPENIKLNIKSNFSIYKNNNISHKKNKLESDTRLKTESNRGSKNIYNILFGNKIYNQISFKNKSCKKNKIPNLNNIFKSQEILFQDNVDNKLRTLILLKPEIKEQLKEKNRCMVGERDYYKYLNYRRKIKNPFYESIKIKEEMNNNY